MTIEFKCSNCLTMLRVSKEHLGKQARCPSCQNLNTVQVAAPEQIEDPIEFVAAEHPSAFTAPQLQTAQHVGGLALSIQSLIVAD